MVSVGRNSPEATAAWYRFSAVQGHGDWGHHEETEIVQKRARDSFTPPGRLTGKSGHTQAAEVFAECGSEDCF
jgi:hypothetical protein